MKTLKIYDPAMCCSSGVCGPNVNETLVNLAGFLKRLDPQDCKVERYNLSQQPEAYVVNSEVSRILGEKGPDILPLFFVDSKLVHSGDYPSPAQLAEHLDISVAEVAHSSSECCPGGSC